LEINQEIAEGNRAHDYHYTYEVSSDLPDGTDFRHGSFEFDYLLI